MPADSAPAWLRYSRAPVLQRRFAASIPIVALVVSAGLALTCQAKVFRVCKDGCRFGTIQAAVDAAGVFKREAGARDARAVVRIEPGRYAEGVFVDGRRERTRFDGLTIEGATKDPREVVLDGRGATGELGAAQNGIEVADVDRLVLRNMWARGYASNGFFIHAWAQRGQSCDGYTMDNLLASANRSYGLFAKGCRGGRMTDSAGWRQGDTAFYIGETPCDAVRWSNHGSAPRPCQAKPRWTLIKNVKSHENVLGYSGTNAKYVKIVDSAFYNNGTGIAPNTLDGEQYEPNGWSAFERNDVFWNNYNHFLERSAFESVVYGLGDLAGTRIYHPTGVGILLYGSDGTVVRDNSVFGNYKWGIASFSGPEDRYKENLGDDAKNVNNRALGNSMGRDGTDPNGEFDFWNDGTGGGNCWSRNTPGSSFAPGSGKVPLDELYPACPQPAVLADQVKSLNLAAGLQVNLGDEGNPATILGYTGVRPPQDQQCSWVRRVSTHPPFKGYRPVEVAARPGELTCSEAALSRYRPAGRRAARPRNVTVADFRFVPAAISIGRGRAVRWSWSPSNAEPHDVHLERGPKGLKDEGSYSTRTTAVTDAHFTRRFPTPGTYRFVCSIHPTKMKLKVTVRR